MVKLPENINPVDVVKLIKNTSFENKIQILVPPKFGNGHLVLSDKCIFHYKQNSEYDRSGQFTIKWNDPTFSFKWKFESPILSERDK